MFAVTRKCNSFIRNTHMFKIASYNCNYSVYAIGQPAARNADVSGYFLVATWGNAGLDFPCLPVNQTNTDRNAILVCVFERYYF